MNSIIVAVVLCQIHMQAVEYILDDQPINSEQISDCVVNCHSFKKGAVFS